MSSAWTRLATLMQFSPDYNMNMTKSTFFPCGFQSGLVFTVTKEAKLVWKSSMKEKVRSVGTTQRLPWPSRTNIDSIDIQSI